VLTGQSIIYFGDQWDGVLRNRQQLMSIFARRNKVLFVEKQSALRPTLDRFQRGDLRLIDLFRPHLRQISENLYVFRYPLYAPVSGHFPVKQFTRLARSLSLRSAVRKLRIRQPIVWFYHPQWVDWVNVVDEYTSYQGSTPFRRCLIEERERDMMAQVDAVVVVSEKLYEAKRLFNPNTYVVPNGVDYRAYDDALADPRLPEELKVIDRPRLGYSGLIGDKLNLSMLKELAQRNPEWSLVFVGPVNASEQAETWRALRALPNVHHLGSVDWSQVPHYVKGFDVGMMPYAQDRFSEMNCPLKLYDYLAAGLPIVSTDVSAAREFSPYVHLAATPEDFPQAVRAALADATPERRQARRAIAAQHTWEKRVEQLSELIQAQLMEKALKRNSSSGGKVCGRRSGWGEWSRY
jgi:glycosyltransferase involved in cell wall biosynthesis